MGEAREITAILYPLDRYVTRIISPYENFVNQNLHTNVREEVKNFLKKGMSRVRKTSSVLWILPKETNYRHMSAFFAIEESDEIIYDEISLKELLYSEKYSNFEKVSAGLREKVKRENVKKINCGGFHLRDCLGKFVNTLTKVFRDSEVVIEVEYGLTDYGIVAFVRQRVEEAYKAFQRQASTKYALAFGVKE